MGLLSLIIFRNFIIFLRKKQFHSDGRFMAKVETKEKIQ